MNFDILSEQKFRIPFEMSNLTLNTKNYSKCRISFKTLNLHSIRKISVKYGMSLQVSNFIEKVKFYSKYQILFEMPYFTQNSKCQISIKISFSFTMPNLIQYVKLN